MYTLNCKGNLLAIEQPLVMGIINVTPDSFYQPLTQKTTEAYVNLANKMISEGADILDIGGQSTRPGSTSISAVKEAERVIPVIEAIYAHNPDIIISVDSFHSRVAEMAVAAGASMVNDISGGTIDPDMIPAVGSLRVPYVCMHIKGTPETMQKMAQYGDVVKEIINYFIFKLTECRAAGIHDVILDPGFGFAKTISHNFTILKQLAVLQILERPILAGLSRKSTIHKTLHISATEALNGTTVLNTIALMHGALILRVHDVKEAKEAVTLFSAYNKA